MRDAGIDPDDVLLVHLAITPAYGHVVIVMVARVTGRRRRRRLKMPRPDTYLEQAETVLLATNRLSVPTLAANASRARYGCGGAVAILYCLPGRISCGLDMYITDLTHFLDRSGTIGPVKGAARTMAEFHVDAVAHATDSTSEPLPAPKCFKCKKGVVEAVLAQDNAVLWICPRCHIEGRISNWQGSLWDLRNRPPTSG